jgi:hypothetical protein
VEAKHLSVNVFLVFFFFFFNHSAYLGILNRDLVVGVSCRQHPIGAAQDGEA